MGGVNNDERLAADKVNKISKAIDTYTENFLKQLEAENGK